MSDLVAVNVVAQYEVDNRGKLSITIRDIDPNDPDLEIVLLALLKKVMADHKRKPSPYRAVG